MSDDTIKSVPAALYARKSADEALTPSSDVQTQIREIHDWAKRNSFHIVAEFVDDAWRGWDLSRPQLQEMMKEARTKERRFKAIIIADWDRFMRRMGVAMELLEELESVGVEIISVRGGRAQTRTEKLGRNMLLFIAEIENEIRGSH